MPSPEDRIIELGLELPSPIDLPPSLHLPFTSVNVRGDRAFISRQPDEHHLMINGFSDLIIEIFGPDIGRHARAAIGVAGLPMGFAMEIEAELELSS